MSRRLIQRQKRLNYRKPLEFPVKNPNWAIKNYFTEFGKKKTELSFKQQRKEYLALLNRKKQEDYARDLRKYRKWQFFWPFYVLWIKSLRFFNLDFKLKQNSQYEFSNDQLELLHENQNFQHTKWKNWPVFAWIVKYVDYLKNNLQTKRFQKNNWIIFWTFGIVNIVFAAVIIAYCELAKEGKVTSVPFADNLQWQNFFVGQQAILESVLVLASLAMVLLLTPIVVLISLLLSNINDINTNLIFVLFQQFFYFWAVVFVIVSACMEASAYCLH